MWVERHFLEPQPGRVEVDPESDPRRHQREPQHSSGERTPGQVAPIHGQSRVEELSFVAPDKSGEAVEINSDYVERNLGELARSTDLSRYVL